MTTYQVIAQDSRVLERMVYGLNGSIEAVEHLKLPAGRVVGEWPLESMAVGHAEKMRKRDRQRFFVRPKP